MLSFTFLFVFLMQTQVSLARSGKSSGTLSDAWNLSNAFLLALVLAEPSVSWFLVDMIWFR